MATAEDRRHHQPPTVVLLRLPSPPYHVSPALSKTYALIKSWELDLPLSRHPAAAAASAAVVSARVSVDAAVLDALPCLQFIMTTSAGTDHIDLGECRRRGIRVCNAGRAFAVDVADYAVGLLIDVMRRVSAGDRFVRLGVWPQKGEFLLGSKLGGKRVGIVGLGQIGSEIAKRLEAFGCTISYNSRTEKPSLSYPYFSNVYDLAVNSDILIVCCSLNTETHHLINKDVVHALGKEGVVINVGRGALVDEKELVRCLIRGEIGAVGLEVFENEPHVPEELFDMDNVVLSPHKAVFTKEADGDMSDLILANLEAFFSNKPLVSPVL